VVATGYRRGTYGPAKAPRRTFQQQQTALGARKSLLCKGFSVERVTGIEPAWPAWKAGALPLSYTRESIDRGRLDYRATPRGVA
jgi:hypothetical protein